MKFNSIKTNITIGFFIAFILFLAAFIPFLKFEQDAVSKEVQTFYKKLSTNIHLERLNPFELEEYLEALNFKEVMNAKELLSKKELKFSSRGFESFKHDGFYYIHILTPRFKVLYKDLNQYEKNYFPYIAFFIVFFLLLFIYIWIMRALKPLDDLKKEIQKFSNGDLNISCRSDKKDEIAQLANEFDKAANKISLLLSSRQLFLRTVMHELKTPIAKGRIVCELVDDEKQKARMVSVFERLDFMIDDFANVEQVISKNVNINRQKVLVASLLEESYKALMINDSKNIDANIDEKASLFVDFKLMTMVFKNLIDNALKYSSDKKVKIEIFENKIVFKSNGDKLQKEFEEYFKPFHNDTNSKNHGMGLGLYIVKSILDLHDMKFSYFHKENQNSFSISF